ncbi:allatostatins MIP isoform X2 [Lucilia cuprina]|uniref:allatostatins MIP isoform X2 n=1 Tax=Lucilia cuprina TaxID=7375 RepID=UPI000C71A72C|nr:allatostatins MIP isoform X2 [Lucilia cuprina]
MHMTISPNQHLAYLFTLHILLAMTLLSTNLGTVCANAVTPEIPTVSDNENEFMMDNDDDMVHAWDKREAQSWGDLMHPWGKREANYDSAMMENGEVVPVLAFFANPAANYENNDVESDNILNEKRGWKKMNVAWGKRRNAGPYMNRGASSWGKREPNWNNLKGMWGKRAGNKEWRKLAGSWGKRSGQLAENQ